MRHSMLVAIAACLTLRAQAPPTAPVVDPRGVVNAHTRQPAPTVVARGGLIAIHGINLGPVAEVAAEGNWPEKLGDVEVLINGRPAPVGLVSTSRILAQVPYEVNPGPAQVVVRRGEASSRPARFQVTMAAPSLKSDNDQGFGRIRTAAGDSVTLQASGLGPSEPRVESGGVGDGIAKPAGSVRVSIGGMDAEAAVTLAKDRVGEYQISFAPPQSASPGDVVSVMLNNQPTINRLTFGQISQPVALHLRLPAGVPPLRNIQSSDLTPTFVLANAAPAADGCTRAWIADLAKMKISADPCLASPSVNALSPAATAIEGNSIAALAGPAEGEAPNAVSSRVKIYSPVRDEALTVQLPSSAIALNSGPQGYVALLGGSPQRTASINPNTGEVQEFGPPQGGGQGGVNVQLLANLQIDLGDGLDKELSLPAPLGQNIFAVVVGDNEDDPSRAKLAAVDLQGNVTGSRDFPEGWVPFVAPQAAPPGGGGPGGPGPGGGPIVIGPGGGLPGGGGPGGIIALPVRFRVPTFNDTAQGRTFYVLARRADNSRHGVAAFSMGGEPAVRAIEFPEGWYAAGCTPQLQFQVLELSRRLAVFGDRTPERTLKNPCPAQGFLLLDLATQSAMAVPVPGQGQMNAAQAPPDLNDFVYATNTDPSRQGSSDVLFVLDSVTATVYRFDPPPNVTAFANLARLPEINALVGLARNRVNGDAGLVLFDLERIETRVFPAPEGFATVQFVGFMPVTRKLVARGIREGNSGTQFLIYDLITGDLAAVPNPEGVAFVGPPPAAAQGPGPGGGPAQQQPVRTQDFSAKSNSIAAVTYDAERRQVGIITVRVP